MTSVKRDLASRRFQRTFLGYLLAGIGGFATFLQVYDVIEPDKIGALGFPIWLPVLVLSAVGAGVAAWPRPIRQQYAKPNTAIHLIEGDLFDRPSNLVIGMTDTFDTHVPHIIASNSLQGQFLTQVFASDLAAFDAALDAALAAIAPVGSVEKEGKTARYAVGTVALIRHHGTKRTYCVAYTTMNKRNEARGSVEGVWESLNSLWRSVRETSNGDPIAMPVIGGGQSRLSQVLPAQDAIRLTALSFMLASRQEKVCDRLEIVIRPEDTKHVDMPEFQAFLSSLK